MRVWKTAAIVAGAFLVVSILYIVFSDQLAFVWTDGAAELGRVQSIKGIVYVSVVAVGLFGLTYLLLRRIDRQTRETQSEREALLTVERRMMAGTLAASIAHDANNLVGVVEANLRVMARDGDFDDDVEAALDDARKATEGLAELNKRLAAAATHQTGEKTRETRLDELVDEAVGMIRTHSRVAGCRVETAVADVRVIVDRGLITHSIVNLMLNAADATDGRGRIRVTLDRDEDWVRIVVEDDGPGIPEDQRDSIIEPFQTSKVQGTGLGLFSVAYCADWHGGDLTIRDSELGGAHVALRLPIAAERSESSEDSMERPHLIDGTPVPAE